MNINSLNLAKIFKPQLQQKTFASAPKNIGLKNDVFERQINFKGNAQKAQTFEQWANETNFLSNIQDIVSNPENKLGSGFLHTAYKIPNSDDYVLRGYNQDDLSSVNFDYGTIQESEKSKAYPNLNVGQTVAKIAAFNQFFIPVELEVLKKQNGKSIGVSPKETNGENDYFSPKNKEKYLSSIGTIAKAPQESYDKLIEDFILAYQAGYHCDYLNSNNILFDEGNNSFGFIDMSEQGVGKNFVALLYSLSNIYYFNDISQSPDSSLSEEEKEEAIKNTVQIFEKYMTALEKNGIEFEKEQDNVIASRLFSSEPWQEFEKEMQ